MIKNIIIVTALVFFGSVALSADLPDSSKLPRMPDSYRKNDYKDLSKRNPYGMSIYEVAEDEAEENYFGTEVLSLEESKRILKERKANQEKSVKEKE